MYRLRGNTFIALLLRAGVQELSEKPEWGEKNNGITRPNLFADLLRMTQPGYDPPKMKSLSSYFSQYLKGDMPFSPMYFSFNTPDFQHGLSSRIQDEYPVVLAEMDAFYRKYLRATPFDRKLLVAGLVDAILADDSFDGEFDIGTKAVGKAELDRQDSFILQPFLVSVWNNILMNHPDASEGGETYMEWTGETGYNKPRQTTTKIGIERTKKIAVSDELPEAAISDTANTDNNEADPCGFSASEESAAAEESAPGEDPVEPEIMEETRERDHVKELHQTIMINNGPGPQIKEHHGDIVINIH